MCDERLADDADALADLRTTARGEGLVQEELVHAFAFGSAVLLRPREAEPTPLPHCAHERASLRRVDDLRHVLAREIEDLGVVVRIEELLDFLGERALLGRELEVHATILQLPHVMTPRSRNCARSASVRPSSSASTSFVCSPTHGTRVSGPSVIFDSFTGFPGTRIGSASM